MKSLTENELAKADGKNRCDRCKRWVIESLKTHLYKCKQCPKCNGFFTFKTRHDLVCKGKGHRSSSKIKCPICPTMLSKGCVLRHIEKVHPKEDVNKFKQKRGAKKLAEKVII